MSALHLQLSASPLIKKKPLHIWSGVGRTAPAGLFIQVCLNVTHRHLIQITEGISYWWGPTGHKVHWPRDFSLFFCCCFELSLQSFFKIIWAQLYHVEAVTSREVLCLLWSLIWYLLPKHITITSKHFAFKYMFTGSFRSAHLLRYAKGIVQMVWSLVL